jgi:predicted TIM-barrel fold metal-dependent hydrolase
VTVVDGHCHVWPDSVAARALAAPSRDLKRFGDGTVSSLLEAMDAGGIDRAVCLGVANTADRVEAANRFAGSLPDRLIGFGSVHPDLPLEENLESLRRYGLRGVKVHPLFQGYALDDARLVELLDAMQGQYVVVVHVGLGGQGSERCTPLMFRELALALPRLGLVACHFGGYHQLDEAAELVVGLPNVHLDTSWPPGVGSLDRVRVREVMERHGPERVCFASDWPMADPGADAAEIRGLGFSEDVTDGVLGGNLLRLIEEQVAS